MSWRPLLLSLPVLAAGGLAIQAAACDASQSLQGGEPLFDAGPEPQAGCDSGCLAQAPANATWPELYKDLFGPAGIGQCGDAQRTNAAGTASTSCHHGPADNGALASGFVCGDTEESCWEGITSPQANFVGQQVVVQCGPTCSYLTQVLRHPIDNDGGTSGIMPFYPETAVISTEDMARVSAWIAAGARRQ